jgi:EAL domain-containing protein (putative c-di-GMP-specific phosphodiesterase class I)/ActR/RegA family two-component response regulator
MESNGEAKGRVLVVDDDNGTRRALRRSLAVAGFEVEEACDGREAIARVGDGFDVVVSDIQMPGLDGVQLLRRIRERDLDVPVVLVTGAPALDSAIRAVEYGALRYLAKPVAPRELASIVGDAARLRRLARAKRDALELLGAEARLVGDRAGLDATFTRALASFWVAYQPIVARGDLRVFGYEALLRSEEPALPHPGAVLEAAERLGAVHALGRAVRKSIAGAVEGEGTGAAFFVNLHPRDLLDDDLFSERAPLTKVASRVVLEITERASLDVVSDVRGRMGALRALGFRLAIDDLGAGYAGLTSFTVVEPDIVKLDMSLVRGIHESAVKQKIVDRMTLLAHELRMTVVAEGIEEPAERAVLEAVGCDLLQGYLFARPDRAFPTVRV